MHHRERKVTKDLVLGTPTTNWVVQTLDECSCSDGNKEFIRTSCLGNNAYIAQRSSNVYGRYLTIVEYRGGGRRNLIIILEEVEDKGWRKMAMELHAMYGNVGKTGGKEQRELKLSNSIYSQKLHVVELPLYHTQR